MLLVKGMTLKKRGEYSCSEEEVGKKEKMEEISVKGRGDKKRELSRGGALPVTSLLF